MLSNLINEDYLANFEATESMEVMDMGSAASTQHQDTICEMNCYGTFGTFGSAGGCCGTFGTFGCGG